MLKRILIILLFFLPLLTSRAQNTASVQNKWHFLAEPYLMFPNLSGTVGLGSLPDASVNASPGDIINHLQMGAMLYLEAGVGKWAITSDLLYMNLSADVPKKSIINSGDVTVKQTAWELAGLYKITGWLEAGAGARLNSINSEAELMIATLPPGTETTQIKSIAQTWVDPILITRITAPFKGKWLLQVRADMGGFGVGSKFAWQVQADAGYRFSKLFQATIGYRYIDVNYLSGTDSDRFLFDMTTFGPTLRLGFNF